MITIKTHLNYLEEIKWLSQVIFEEILGLNYILEIHDEEDFKVITNEKEIVLENFFLKNQKKKWLKPFSFKEMSIKYINLFDCFNREFYQDNLPVIFGNPNIKIFKNKYIFNFDVLGTIFFFLSDYESACSPYKDKHERFEFKNSILSKEDLIYRPIVDEYIEILMHAIKVLNPSLNPIKTKSKLSISCDVDNPYNEYTKSFILTLKKCAGDILKRKSSKDFFITLTNYFLSKLGVYIFDDLFNFNWMMDEAEKNKLKINFFFIFLKSDKQMDGYYSLNEKALMDLLLNIHHRKHIIGIHSSYKTFNNPILIRKELKKFRSVLKENKINQEEIINRQHYLKFSYKTFEYLSKNLVSMDCSITFAANPGFRCGTSRTFSMFDLQNREILNIKQQPLIIMDNSILSETYMGVTENESVLGLIKDLKKAVDYFGGTLSILWHNDSLRSSKEKSLYKNILSLQF